MTQDKEVGARRWRLQKGTAVAGVALAAVVNQTPLADAVTRALEDAIIPSAVAADAGTPGANPIPSNPSLADRAKLNRPQIQTKPKGIDPGGPVEQWGQNGGWYQDLKDGWGQKGGWVQDLGGRGVLARADSVTRQIHKGSTIMKAQPRNVNDALEKAQQPTASGSSGARQSGR
jgi:hypothetical protein